MARSMGVLLTLSLLLIGFGIASSSDLKPPSQQIAWQGNIFAAYKQACKENKPLVVYFHLDYCSESKGRSKFCAKLEENALRSAEFNSFADKAIFVWQDAEKDDEKGNVSRLLKSLQIERIPAVAVIECSEDKMQEIGHVTGYHSTEKFMMLFNQVWNKRSPSRTDDDVR